MLHVNSAVSGEAIATIQLHEFDGKFVKELKQSLVAKTGFTRFQQKLLCQDHGTVCLDDDLLIPGNSQLVFLPFLAQDESGQEICQLHRACRDCDFQAIEVILQEPQDPNFSDRDGKTALHWAAQSGAAAECGALLVEAAGDLNQRANDGYTPLLRAVAYGRLDSVRALVECGADMNGKTEDGRGETPLHMAALHGNKKCLSLLLNARADTEIARVGDGATPLHLAILHRTPQIAGLLVTAGANKNAMTKKHKTCLHLAAEIGHVEGLRLLLDAAADPNRVTIDGSAALHLAAAKGYVECVRLLIESAADVCKVNGEGQLPLDLANHFDMCEVASLLQNGPILKCRRIE